MANLKKRIVTTGIEKPDGTANAKVIRRALQQVDQEMALRDAYTILYKTAQTIGAKLDDLESRVAALEA
jgi:hypothetical protein